MSLSPHLNSLFLAFHLPLGVIVLFSEVACFYMSERTYLLNIYLVHTAPKLNAYLSK